MEQVGSTELVLEAICKFLPHTHLKIVRLVNKKWNKIAVVELRKRSAAIHLDHDLANFKKFYNLELVSKNQEIAAKIPMSVHIRNGKKSDWKILKDLATHEPWKTRVTTLMLSDFWASDLNIILPVLLSSLPNLSALTLSALNNRAVKYKANKYAIIENIEIPAAQEIKSVKSISLVWYGAGFDCRSQTYLDHEIFLLCTSLKEFLIESNFGRHDVLRFFDRLYMYSLDSNCFNSVERLGIQAKLDDDANDYIIAVMMVLGTFINRVKPTTLELTHGKNFDPVFLFKMLCTEIRNLALDVPRVPGDSLYFCTSWLLSSIQTRSAFSNLEELNLRPCVESILDKEPVMPPASELKHDLSRVTKLKLSFDTRSKIVENECKHVFQEASNYLPNIQQVDFCDLYMDKFMGDVVRVEKLTGIFEGLKNFPKLQKVTFELVDFAGDLIQRGQRVHQFGKEGLFAGLSLLKDSALQEISVSANLDYDLSIGSVLTVFFASYEPSVKLSLDLNRKSAGHVKLQLSKEEFEQALRDAEPEFHNICLESLPGYDKLSPGMPRYLKMTNYKPTVKYPFM